MHWDGDKMASMYVDDSFKFTFFNENLENLWFNWLNSNWNIFSAIIVALITLNQYRGGDVEIRVIFVKN